MIVNGLVSRNIHKGHVVHLNKNNKTYRRQETSQSPYYYHYQLVEGHANTPSLCNPATTPQRAHHTGMQIHLLYVTQPRPHNERIRQVTRIRQVLLGASPLTPHTFENKGRTNYSLRENVWPHVHQEYVYFCVLSPKNTNNSNWRAKSAFNTLCNKTHHTNTMTIKIHNFGRRTKKCDRINLPRGWCTLMGPHCHIT